MVIKGEKKGVFGVVLLLYFGGSCTDTYVLKFLGLYKKERRINFTA